MWTEQHKSDKSVVVNGSEKSTKATMNRITNGRSKQLGNIRHFRFIFGGGRGGGFQLQYYYYDWPYYT